MGYLANGLVPWLNSPLVVVTVLEAWDLSGKRYKETRMALPWLIPGPDIGQTAASVAHAGTDSAS